jgi:hypothetical protein
VVHPDVFIDNQDLLNRPESKKRAITLTKEAACFQSFPTAGSGLIWMVAARVGTFHGTKRAEHAAIAWKSFQDGVAAPTPVEVQAEARRDYFGRGMTTGRTGNF